MFIQRYLGYSPFKNYYNKTKNFLKLGKEIDIQLQEAQSSKQDEPKEVHIATHNN